MGQDTYVNNGVYVSIKLTFENLNLINKMMQENIAIHYQTEPDCNNDEVREIVDIDNYKKIIDAKTEEEFNQELENTELKPKQKLMCLIQVFQSYARNISRRDNPWIFGHCDLSFNKMIKQFKEARKKFIDLGFPKKKIHCGYSFVDSY
jgi:hypothetical protein